MSLKPIDDAGDLFGNPLGFLEGQGCLFDPGKAKRRERIEVNREQAEQAKLVRLYPADGTPADGRLTG